MLIDWFTVGAQALNFIVLVWLLKRFLYQPILDAIDAREKRIAQELASANEQQIQAQQQREIFQQKNETFELQRNSLMQEAITSANDEHKKLITIARQTADEMSQKRHQALVHEQQMLSSELSRRTRDEVFAITRKTLKDLADVSLEDRITHLVLERLSQLDADTKDEFRSVLNGENNKPIIVRSAFNLTTTQQQTIKQALQKTFGNDTTLEFDMSSDIIGGIELRADGQKLAWSIAEYLDAMQKNIDELLSTQAKQTEAGQSS